MFFRREVIFVMLLCIFQENSMHIDDYGYYKRHRRVHREVKGNLSLLLVFSVFGEPVFFSLVCLRTAFSRIQQLSTGAVATHKLTSEWKGPCRRLWWDWGRGFSLLEQQAYSLLTLALNHSRVSSLLPHHYSSHSYIRVARYGSTQSGQHGPIENNQSQSEAKMSLWSRLQGWVTVCLADVGLNHFRLGALQLNSSDTHFSYFLPSQLLCQKQNSCLFFSPLSAFCPTAKLSCVDRILTVHATTNNLVSSIFLFILSFHVHSRATLICMSAHT